MKTPPDQPTHQWQRLGRSLTRPLALALLCGLAFAQNTAPQNTAPAPAKQPPAAQTQQPEQPAKEEQGTQTGTETPAGTGTQTQPPEQPQPGQAQPAKEQAPESPAQAAPAQSAPAGGDGQLPQVSITIERKTKSGEKRRIEIVRVGTDETGISATCAPLDDEPEDAPTMVVYSDTTERGVQVTVDKNLIRAPLAVVTKQTGGDGHIEMTAGTARYLDEAPPGKTDRLSRCEVEAKPDVKNDSINVTQGKTKLKGSKLVYDESDGVARINGPITFTREKMNGQSERIDVDVEHEVTTLVGNVELRDGDRTSKAGRVDYDDTKNVAILRGTAETPAETVTPKDTLRAETIRYNLDTGEAVVLRGKGPVTGKFEDGDGGDNGGSGPGNPADSSPANTGNPGKTGTPGTAGAGQ